MAKQTMTQIKGFLRAHGISPSYVDTIRLALLDEAVQQAQDMHADRVLTLIALSLRECFGFGHQRIFKALLKFDEMSGQLASGERQWHEVMKELHEKTGIVVSTRENERLVFEYRPEGMDDGEE